ncbi:hypothetical protein AAE478_010497 [Parahypoxylon ruwenzoriense]
MAQVLSALLTEFEIVEEWMRIELKPGWQENIPKRCRNYPLTRESESGNHDMVDQRQGGRQGQNSRGSDNRRTKSELDDVVEDLL